MLEDDVIVPPPNVRGLLEKTASAVGKTPALESRIALKHATDPRFAFMRPSDPYHAYYQAKVKGAQKPAPSSVNDGASNVEGEAKLSDNPAVANDNFAVLATPTVLAPAEAESVVAPAVSKLSKAKLKSASERPVPENPPSADLFSVLDVIPAPDLLSLHVMKIVAQSCARDGRDFLNLLAEKEMRNPLFDFLKPMHPHFPLFQRFVDAYGAILERRSSKEPGPPGSLLHGQLSKSKALSKFWYRHDWQKQKTSQGDPKTSVAEDFTAGALDWHDFVVLETIDLDENEVNLPAPLADPTQIPRVMAAADSMRQQEDKNKEDVDMDLDMEMDGGEVNGESINRIDSVVITADVDSDIPSGRVRRGHAGDYSQPPANSASVRPAPSTGPNLVPQTQNVRLPDGQIVPLSEATPAMRAQLIDPKYKEERMRASAKNQRQNLADGDQVALQLARLNKSKPDSGVYNRGDLQASLAERTKGAHLEPVDLPAPARSGPALPKDSTNEEMDHPAKKARVEAAVGALTQAAASKETEPSLAKRDTIDGDAPAAAGTNDASDGLVPEAEWLAKVGDKISIVVAVPTHSNKDWVLAGQEIILEVPLKSTVQRLKEVLAKSACTKVPANKQKLHYEGVGFLSNRRTLASYNIAAGGKITLEVKERGGRKKPG